MGCICAKPSAVEAIQESPKERLSRKESSNAHVLGANSLKRDEEIEEKYKLDSGDVKVMLIDKKVNGSARLDAEVQIEKKNIQKLEIGGVDYPGKGSVPKALEGEQVAAGWPAWLAAVTGEAIKGWVPRRADTFEKLDKIGEGTYSSVYKARDLLHNKIVALKKVRFDNLDQESIKFMAREIVILRRLDHPNIIKLDGLITSRTSCSLYLIFEYMEHDLTGLGSLPGIKFTQPQIKCYMHQLLSGLDHCHSRGVLHRDIKGSNLLIDNNGILKIADFGLASFFNSHHSVPLTSRVVTLWYRPPELLLGASHYGVAIDLWSTGCILGELYAGKPILPGRTEVEQLHKIFKLCGSPSEDYWRKSKLRHSTVFKPLEPYRRCLGETFKDYSAAAVELMDTLLSIDPDHRGSATSALASEFFTSQPLPCDPSSLPKYPPSKEIDAKLREDKARKIVPCATRQGAVGGSRGQKADMERAGPRKFWEIPARTANAGLTTLAQKIHSHSNSKSRSEIFNSHRERAVCRTLIDPLKQTQGGVREGSKDFSEHPCKNASQSGSLVRGTRWAKSGKEFDDPPMVPAGANLSTLSGFVSTRNLPYEVCQEKPGTSQPEAVNRSRRSINESESAGKQDRKQHIPRIANSQSQQQQMGDGQFSTKEPIPRGRDSRENKIYVSGSLLVPSNNVDQMLKEHDLRIQEFARRARFDKKRVGNNPH